MTSTSFIPVGMYEYIRQAATHSEFKKHRHGAVVLNKKGHVLGYGWNKRKTHPIQKKHAEKAGHYGKEYLHAEIDALLSSFSKLSVNYSIIVGRLNSKDKLTYSRPCPVCMRAIKEAGIKEIWYTGYKGELIKELV